MIFVFTKRIYSPNYLAMMSGTIESVLDLHDKGTAMKKLTATSILLTTWLCASQQASAQQWNFEQAVSEFGAPAPDITFHGNGGYDLNLGFGGSGNAWIRASGGWNAIETVEPRYALSDCYASVMLQGSPNIENIFFSILDAGTGEVLVQTAPLSGPQLTGQRIPSCAENRSCQVGEVPMEGWSPYSSHSVNLFDSQRWVRLRVGFWGNGQDAWLRVDNLSLQCSAAREW